MGNPLNIVGQKFGKLTAIESVGKNKSGCYDWLFQCDCGNTHVSTTGNVRRGGVRSCGCLLTDKTIDITGEKHGRLTAICRVGGGGRKQRITWLFRCDCGNEITASANSVRRGNTKSCGCLSFESKSARSRNALRKAQAACVTHGKTGTRIYKIYKGMKQRCYNEKNPNFKYYGGKGITLCDEWFNDPLSFINWAESHGYGEGLTIDRVDSDNGYSPDNCEFITQAAQARKAVIVREKSKATRMKNAAS